MNRYPTCIIGDDLGGAPIFICLRCSAPPSHHLEDVANLFCGHCKKHHKQAMLTSALIVAGDYVEFDLLVQKLNWLLQKLTARPPRSLYRAVPGHERRVEDRTVYLIHWEPENALEDRMKPRIEGVEVIATGEPAGGTRVLTLRVTRSDDAARIGEEILVPAPVTFDVTPGYVGSAFWMPGQILPKLVLMPSERDDA